MFEIAEYIGIVAFAMSGFFVAIRNKLDLLGIFIATFLTALGGGIARDVIVHEKPYTFSSDTPALIVLGVMIIMIALQFHKKDSIENRFFFILSDSLGLVSFSITGALVAIDHSLNLTGVMALAFITAVGGGIARDVIINEVPFVFKSGFYGTIALLIALAIYTLHVNALLEPLTLSIVFVVATCVRVFAFYKKWSIQIL
jgi:uncharacterized membrane protein YeiH